MKQKRLVKTNDTDGKEQDIEEYLKNAFNNAWEKL